MRDGLAYDDMTTSYDIVAELKEEIDEEKLGELARQYACNSAIV